MESHIVISAPPVLRDAVPSSALLAMDPASLPFVDRQLALALTMFNASVPACRLPQYKTVASLLDSALICREAADGLSLNVLTKDCGLLRLSIDPPNADFYRLPLFDNLFVPQCLEVGSRVAVIGGNARIPYFVSRRDALRRVRLPFSQDSTGHYPQHGACGNPPIAAVRSLAAP